MKNSNNVTAGLVACILISMAPGPGFGGSCFPSQSRALQRLAASYGVRTPLMDAIWPSNVSQADWLLDGLERATARPVTGMRVALLGLTFKAGTDDLRESPAVAIIDQLRRVGAAISPTAGAAPDHFPRWRAAAFRASSSVMSPTTTSVALPGVNWVAAKSFTFASEIAPMDVSVPDPSEA